MRRAFTIARSSFLSAEPSWPIRCGRGRLFGRSLCQAVLSAFGSPALLQYGRPSHCPPPPLLMPSPSFALFLGSLSASSFTSHAPFLPWPPLLSSPSSLPPTHPVPSPLPIPSSALPPFPPYSSAAEIIWLLEVKNTLASFHSISLNFSLY